MYRKLTRNNIRPEIWLLVWNIQWCMFCRPPKRRHRKTTPIQGAYYSGFVSTQMKRGQEKFSTPGNERCRAKMVRKTIIRATGCFVKSSGITNFVLTSTLWLSSSWCLFLQQLFDHNRRFNGVEKIQISRPNSKGVGEFFRLRLLKVSNEVFVLILFGAQTNFANFFFWALFQKDFSPC